MKMRNCPRCNNTAVIEDGYCGCCRECTMRPSWTKSTIGCPAPLPFSESTFQPFQGTAFTHYRRAEIDSVRPIYPRFLRLTTCLRILFFYLLLSFVVVLLFLLLGNCVGYFLGK